MLTIVNDLLPDSLINHPFGYLKEIFRASLVYLSFKAGFTCLSEDLKLGFVLMYKAASAKAPIINRQLIYSYFVFWQVFSFQ